MSNTLYFQNYKNTQKALGTIRKPCMTLKELSRAFGIPYSTVRAKFKKNGCHIDPVFKKSRRKAIYFDCMELRKWAKENL